MSFSRTFYKRLRSIFPRDSPFARAMWALLAIRADLMIEMPMIGGDDALLRRIDPLEVYARSYFFRGSLVTLHSGRILLDHLMSVEEFRELLQTSGKADEFKAQKRVVDEADAECKSLRDRAAGHIETSIADSLLLADADADFSFSYRNDEGVSSNFAAEAVLLTLFGDAHDVKAFEARSLGVLTRMRDAQKAAMYAIDLALDLYDRKYGLLRS